MQTPLQDGHLLRMLICPRIKHHEEGSPLDLQSPWALHHKDRLGLLSTLNDVGQKH